MRVLVAMSGGVDSSVVAGLLHEAGHEVIGVTLQLYDHGAASGRKGACCAGQDIHDARRVADRLGIAHYVDRRRGALRPVGDRATSPTAMQRGETPVPCITLQPDGEVRRPDRSGARSGRGAAGDRALCAAGRWAGWRGAASRGRSGAGPELVPVRDDPGAAGSVPVSAGRHAGQARGARRGASVWAWRWRTSRTVRTSVSCPPAAMPTSSAGCGRMRWSRARSSPRDGAVVGRHDGIARYTVGQGKRLGDAAMLDGERQVVVATEPGRRRVIVGRRGTGTYRCGCVRSTGCLPA